MLAASDDFERGLGSWHLRGRVATSREAATHGRRGLRMTVSGERGVHRQRLLPQAGDELELRFRPESAHHLDARLEPGRGNQGPKGRRVASIDLPPSRGSMQLRVSASKGTRAAVQSQPLSVQRRPVSLTLSLAHARTSLSAGDSALQI